MGIEGISGGGMRSPQAWQIRGEAKQVADPDPRQFADMVEATPDVETQGGMSGMAALEFSRRIDEIRKTTIADVSALDAAGMSQHNFINLEMQSLPVLRQDVNHIKPRTLQSMLDGQ